MPVKYAAGGESSGPAAGPVLKLQHYATLRLDAELQLCESVSGGWPFLGGGRRISAFADITVGQCAGGGSKRLRKSAEEFECRCAQLGHGDNEQSKSQQEGPERALQRRKRELVQQSVRGLLTRQHLYEGI